MSEELPVPSEVKQILLLPATSEDYITPVEDDSERSTGKGTRAQMVEIALENAHEYTPDKSSRSLPPPPIITDTDIEEKFSEMINHRNTQLRSKLSRNIMVSAVTLMVFWGFCVWWIWQVAICWILTLLPTILFIIFLKNKKLTLDLGSVLISYCYGFGEVFLECTLAQSFITFVVIIIWLFLPSEEENNILVFNILAFIWVVGVFAVEQLLKVCLCFGTNGGVAKYCRKFSNFSINRNNRFRSLSAQPTNDDDESRILLSLEHMLCAVSFSIGFSSAQILFTLVSVAAILRYSEHANINWIFLFGFFTIVASITLNLQTTYLTELQLYRGVFSRMHCLTMPMVVHIVFGYAGCLALIYCELYPLVTIFCSVIVLLLVFFTLAYIGQIEDVMPSQTIGILVQINPLSKLRYSRNRSNPLREDNLLPITQNL